MDQVRGAVIPLDVPAPGGLDGREHRSRVEAVRGPPYGRALLVLSNRSHVEAPALAAHRPDIAHLPTRFGIERVLAEAQLELRSRLAEGEDIALRLRGVVSDETLLAAADVPPLAGATHMHRRRVSAHSRRACVAGALPLRVEGALEAGHIDTHPALTGNDLGEVDGESIGVVETKRLVARYLPNTRTEELVEPAKTALDRLQKAFLLVPGDVP